MKTEHKNRNNIYAKVATGLAMVFIYVGISMYVKTARQAKPSLVPHENSDVVTTQNNFGNTPTQENSNANTSKPPATNNGTPIKNTPTNVNNTPPQAVPPPQPAPAPATAYKNGTYTVDGSYMCPAGLQKIGITVTINNDVITATSAENKAGSSTPSEYQNDFISHYKSFVVGKNIADLHLGKVARSSLTPDGFNNALAKIKTAAKS